MDSRMLSLFDARVSVEPNTGCWIWIGNVTSKGYPRLSSKKKDMSPARLALDHFVAPLSDDLVVSRTCQTELCVNPDHLNAHPQGQGLTELAKESILTHELHMDASTLARFMKYVSIEPNTGCWLWIGSLFQKSGYARFSIGKHYMQAHRVSYKHFIGPPPEGLVLDHETCDTRCCVNPHHLKPKTIAANVMRGTGPAAMNARKTHCPKGHLYDIVRSNGVRECRLCRNEAAVNRRRLRCNQVNSVDSES